MKTILVVTTVQVTISGFLIPHIKRLQAKGMQVEVATSVSDLPKLRAELEGVTIHHIPFSRSLTSMTNLKAYGHMRKLMKQKNYDAVHVHTPIASFVTRMAAGKTCKVIYTVHGFHYNENGGRLSNLLYYMSEKIAGYKTDKLIVINSDDYSFAPRVVDKRKVSYIKGIGVDVSKYNAARFSSEERIGFRAQLGIPDDCLVITHLAEFNANKRQIDVVFACEQLKKRYEKFVVLLAGNGHELPNIKAEIEARGLSEHVKCLGMRSDIEQILSVTDIGLLVSLREGLPRSVMEMMAMGIPVVLTSIRGNRDLVTNGENGFLVPVRCPGELADALAALIADPALRMRMGRASQERIQHHYELNKILQDHDVVYRELELG